jgi:hypothetical protein
MKKLVLFFLVLLLVGCQSNQPDTPEPEQPAVVQENTPQSNNDAADEPVATITSQPEAETPDMELVVTGPEEVVFDWTTDRCEDENIPDIAPRVFRGADGQVQLTIGHLKTYRMVGPDLDNLKSDCSAPVMTSDLNDDPAMFNDGEWIGALYTPDGETVYGVIHSEYRGHLHGDTHPDQCPSGDYLTCLDTALTMVISTDGGDSYQDIAEAPNHLIATLPHRFDDQGVPSGLRQPSIIHALDGYFYIFANISDYPTEEQWACVMRTDNLDDPSSWRYWDGNGFNGQFVNPYIEAVDANPPTCARPADPDLAAGLVESVTYNTVLEKYIAVGMSAHPTTTPERLMWGIYYSVSDDLLDWSRRRLLLEVPMVASVADPGSELIYAYPVLIDPDSPSINFDTNDDELYLYVSKFNFGGGSLDRDLVRYPLQLAPAMYEIPDWEFETEGDVEWWWPENHIEEVTASDGVLSMVSSGDDPYMSSSAVEFPAHDYGTLSITMKVSEGDPTIGEIFFLTDTDSTWDGDKYLVFDVISDGEFHTYDLDMSSIGEWRGLIQQIRIDPVVRAGRTIEIDRIAVVP